MIPDVAAVPVPAAASVVSPALPRGEEEDVAHGLGYSWGAEAEASLLSGVLLVLLFAMSVCVVGVFHSSPMSRVVSPSCWWYCAANSTVERDGADAPEIIRCAGRAASSSTSPLSASATDAPSESELAPLDILLLLLACPDTSKGDAAVVVEGTIGGVTSGDPGAEEEGVGYDPGAIESALEEAESSFDVPLPAGTPALAAASFADGDADEVAAVGTSNLRTLTFTHPMDATLGTRMAW